MASIINKVTGYYGFTVDGVSGGSSDTDGRVNRCIFVIGYPNQRVNTTFDISTGSTDWGAKMGDGEIIPLTNPKILYVNRDGAIVQFDMSSLYAANSPCFLVYRSDSAYFRIKNINEAVQSFTVNHASSNFAFTVEGYGGSTDEDGKVSKLIATFPFPVQRSKMVFSISTDTSHWGAHMGDGTVVTLRNPTVISTNYDCGTVLFDMDTAYPSNSPCIIVYRSANAYMKIEPDIVNAYVPVTNISNVVSSIISGIEYDLSKAMITPVNASKQTIDWTLLSGNANLVGDKLTATEGGTLTIRAIVYGGGNVSGSADYIKDFTINVTQNVITIPSQPAEVVDLIYGEVNTSLMIKAASTSGTLNYQWYRNSIEGVAGAIALENGNESSYVIPSDIASGTYYYFCRVTSPGAVMVNTNFSKVTVTPKLTSIKITGYTTTTYKLEDVQQLTFDAYPSGCVIPKVMWKSSDETVIVVNDTGLMTVIAPGSAKITISTTVDGVTFTNSLTIKVEDYIPITDITNILTTMDTETQMTLTPTIVPANATKQTIIWSMVEVGDTMVELDGLNLYAPYIGSFVIRATVEAGVSPHVDFIKDYLVNVTKKFVPVTNITLNGVPSDFRSTESCELSCTVTPIEATNRAYTLAIADAGTTGAILTGNTLIPASAGTVKIKATVKNGKTISTDYTKTFSITVNKKFIPVESISGYPSEWLFAGKKSDTLTLNGTVLPADAENKTITYRIKNDPGYKVKLSGNTLTLDYTAVTWWIENPEAADFDYFTDAYIEAITDPLVIEARITNGASPTEDFVFDISIMIEPSDAPTVHLALETISVKKPSIMRAKRPFVMDYDKEPWNATNGTIHTNLVRRETNQGGVAMSFDPDSQSLTYWDNMYNIRTSDNYDWGIENVLYLYPYEDGNLRFSYEVEKGNADKTTFIASEDVVLLPEYLPIKNMTNIPTSIPKNIQLLLAPEFDTDYPVEKRSTEVYDVEVPSYTVVDWSVVSAGNTAAVIKDGKISFSGTGTCKIRATVENGVEEEFEWYGTSYKGKAYTQDFTIKVTSNETSYHDPVLTLTLTDNKTISIYKETEIQNLCNDLPSDTSITAGNMTFRKDEIKEVKFWDETPAMGDDYIIPLTNISLNTPATERWNGVNKTLVKAATPGTKATSIRTRADLTGRTSIVDCNTLSTSHKCYVDTASRWYILPKADLILTKDGKIKQMKDATTEVDIISECGGKYVTSGYNYTELFTLEKILSEIGDGVSIIEWTDERVIIRFDDINDDTGIVATYYISQQTICFINQNITDKTKTVPSVVCIRQIFGSIDISSFNVNSKFSFVADLFLKTYLISEDSIIYYSQILEAPAIIQRSPYFKAPLGWSFDSSGNVVRVNDELNLPDDITMVDLYNEALASDFIRLPYGKYSTPNIIFEPCITFDRTNKKIMLTAVRDGDTTSIADLNIRSIGNVCYMEKINGMVFNIDKYTNSNIIVHCVSTSNGSPDYIAFDDNLYTQNYLLLRDQAGSISISPSNATATYDDINWGIIDYNNIGIKMHKFVINPTYDYIATCIAAGTKTGNFGLEITVPDGMGWYDQDYRDVMVCTVGSASSTTEVAAVNPSNKTIGYVVYTSYSSSYRTISGNVVGVNLGSSVNSSIKWTVTGGTKSGTGIRTGRTYTNGKYTDTIVSSYTASSVELAIAAGEVDGNVITLTASYGGKSVDLKFTMYNYYSTNYSITKLTNFCRNCINLTKIDRIPDQITGESCLRNFLKGCISFNQKITIPDYVEGDRCLEGFLSDCTSFNQPITIPDGVTGYRSMCRFLEGCTSFNQEVLIPTAMTGKQCLMRFLSGCTSYNKPTYIPHKVSGVQCLDHFLNGCTSFNQDIWMPTQIKGTANMRGFMRDTPKMTSVIYLGYTNIKTKEANGLTLANFTRDIAYDTGVRLYGAGVADFLTSCPNMVSLIPLRRLIDVSTSSDIGYAKYTIIPITKDDDNGLYDVTKGSPIELDGTNVSTLYFTSPLISLTAGFSLSSMTAPATSGYTFSNISTNTTTITSTSYNAKVYYSIDIAASSSISTGTLTCHNFTAVVSNGTATTTITIPVYSKVI